MSDLDDKPTEAATELMHPADTNGDGKATPGLPSDPSARANQTQDPTGIPHGVQPDDLAEDAIETLAMWLGTNAEKNITPVAPSARTGTPAVSTNYGTTQEVFARDLMASPAGTLDAQQENSIMNAGVGSLWGGANEMLKNVQDTGGLGGARLVADVPLEPENAVDAHTVAGAVSGVLARNRWVQGTPIAVGDETGGLTGKGVMMQSYMLRNRAGDSNTRLGLYSKYDDPAVTGEGLTDEVHQGLTIGAASDMAEAMLRKAAGGSVGLEFNEVKLGTGRVDTADLRPLKNVTGFAGPPLGTVGPTGARTSYGVLNYPGSKFGGALPIDMIILAAISALVVLIAVLVLCLVLDLFGLIPGFPPKKHDGMSGGATLPLGRRFGDANFGFASFVDLLYRFLKLPMMSYDYGFIGSFFTFLIAGSVGVIQFYIPRVFGVSAGYFNVINRNAMRDIDQITNAAEEVGNASGVGILEAVFLLIDAFTTSATYKLATTLIALGDTVLVGTHGAANFGATMFAELDFPIEKQLTNATVGDLAWRGRLKNGSNKQALAFNTLPRLYNLEHGLYWDATVATMDVKATSPDDATFLEGGMHDGLGTIVIGAAASSQPNKPFISRFQSFANGRIPTEIREAMEVTLNAYYVPFYFHDLRTNEIVPFHCFVEGISDSFSPEYDQVKGFGRMDPVQIYKGTTRKIGMSFWIAATGPGDYDDMWFAINRLVAMVYPQWSMGDIRETAGGSKFIMPFSSVPSASPVIRIRLGELFASNTAPESVRRLFGYGNEDVFALGTDVGDSGTASVEGRAADKDFKSIQASFKATMGDIFKSLNTAKKNHTNLVESGIDGFDCIMIAATGLANAPFNGDILKGPLKLNFFAEGLSNHSGYIPGTVVTLNKATYRGAKWTGLQFATTWRRMRFDTPVLGEVCGYAAIPLKVKDSNNDGSADEIKRKWFSKLYYVVRPYNESFNLDYFPPPKLGGVAGLCVPMEDAIYHEVQTYRNMYALASSPPVPLPFPVEADPTPGELADELFFKPDANAIVRSFKEAGGMGLAGVITNLDFDWNVAPWETDSGQGRAPKYVKCTLGFAPIHDIPPGIGYDGAMRAPVYPVGQVVQDRFGTRFEADGEESMKEMADKATMAARAVMDMAIEDKATEFPAKKLKD